MSVFMNRMLDTVSAYVIVALGVALAGATAIVGV
jgi:hypothetical protein